MRIEDESRGTVMIYSVEAGKRFRFDAPKKEVFVTGPAVSQQAYGGLRQRAKEIIQGAATKRKRNSKSCRAGTATNTPSNCRLPTLADELP